MLYTTAMALVLMSCSDTKEGSSNNKEGKNEESLNKPSAQEDENEDKNGEKPIWMAQASSNGVITIQQKGGDENQSVTLNIQANGETFKKEVSLTDGKGQVTFPSDFGLEEFSNVLLDAGYSSSIQSDLKLMADGQEVYMTKAILPTQPVGMLRPLYSIEVEFPQNPKLPKLVGSIEGMSHISFFADTKAYHYLKSSISGKFEHYIQKVDGTVELLFELQIPPTECEGNSTRMGYTYPIIKDADNNDAMEVYIAYVNSCIDEEVYTAIAEFDGDIIGQRSGRTASDMDEPTVSPKEKAISEALNMYLSGVLTGK